MDLLPSFQLQRVKINGVRYYKLPDSDIAFPSVTTVLKDFNKSSLDSWRKRVGEKEAKRISGLASTFGSKLHKAAEQYMLEGSVPHMDVFTKQRFRAVRALIDQRITGIKAIEPKLYSDKLKLAGSVDLICEFDGQLSILDWKTSSKPKTEEMIQNYLMQTCYYAVMAYERYGIVCDKLVVVISVEEDVNNLQIFQSTVKKWLPFCKEWLAAQQIQPVNLKDVEGSFEYEPED